MKTRQRTCRNRSCRKKFTPAHSGAWTCSFSCAVAVRDEKIERDTKRAMRLIEQRRKEQARGEKRKRAADRERVKTRSELRAEAITAFNAWIRYRDRFLPCITCQRPPHVVEQDPPLRGGVWDAGHFQSTGAAPEKRFLEDNVHRQCKACNKPGGHSRDQYERNLRERIGDARVDAVLAPRGPQRYTADAFRAIRDNYRLKLRQAKAADKALIT